MRHPPLDIDESCLGRDAREPVPAERPVGGSADFDLPFSACRMELKVLHVVVLTVVVPVPELEGDGTRFAIGGGGVDDPVDLGRRRSGALVAQQLVIGARTDQQRAVRTQHAVHLAEGRVHVLFRQQMRQGVVGADDSVEPAVEEGEMPHVRDGRPQAEALAGSLPSGTGGSASTEVGPGDEVPARGQTDGLSADTASTVEHCRTILTDQSIQGLPLPLDARLPVRVDQVVVVGQIVVEARG